MKRLALIALLVSFGTQAEELTGQELEDAKEFAGYVIQSKGYTCDKVTTFSNANFSGRIDIWCDDQYRYEITKPGGNWKVEAIN